MVSRVISFTAVLFAIITVAWPVFAVDYPAPAPPNVFDIKLTTEGVELTFRWDTPQGQPKHGFVGFHPTHAVEFEIHVYDKCYVMPPSGKDWRLKVGGATGAEFLPQTFAAQAKAYVDVWNYYQPTSTPFAVADVHRGVLDGYCSGLDEAATFAIFPFLKNFLDNDGNFAVGVEFAALLKRDVGYTIRYKLAAADPSTGIKKLDVGGNLVDACPLGPAPSSAFGVHMETLPRTCSRDPWGLNPLNASSCPFFTGFWACDEVKADPKDNHSWHEQICAPTESVPLPVLDDLMPLNEGHCVDVDHDEAFALLDPVSPSHLPMFGSHVTDCNDADDTIVNCLVCGLQGNSCCLGPAFCDAGLVCDAVSATCMVDLCSDGVQSPGEGGIDCGGQCAVVCCPGNANGFFCGFAALGHDPNSLYYCANGVYSLWSGCGGAGCIANPSGTPDACSTCGDSICLSPEDCSSCAADCGACPCPPGPSSQPCAGCGTQTRVCQSDGTWSAWSSCQNQNSCPQGQSCDGNTNVCVGCGGNLEACCVGGLCQGGSSLVCFAGTCTSCGLISEPCCDASTIGMNGAACSNQPVAAACNPSTFLCDPAQQPGAPGSTPITVFFENFESISWSGVGQTSLYDGISLWDVSQSISSVIQTPGAPWIGSQSLQWYGGNQFGGTPASTVTLTFPGGGLQGTTDVELSFDYQTHSGLGPLPIVISRAGCPAVPVSLSSPGTWASYEVILPQCNNTSKIVFQIGSIYDVSSSYIALMLDNLKIRYVYPEVCDIADPAKGSFDALAHDRDDEEIEEKATPAKTGVVDIVEPPRRSRRAGSRAHR